MFSGLLFFLIMLILLFCLSEQESPSGKKRSGVWLPVYGLARNSLKEPSSNFNGQGQPQKRTDFLFLERLQCLEHPMLDFNPTFLMAVLY